jgi:Flp pilus assembly protein CpaB
MKPARIVVLLIALAAGGIAALLAGRSDPPAAVGKTATLELTQRQAETPAAQNGRRSGINIVRFGVTA